MADLERCSTIDHEDQFAIGLVRLFDCDDEPCTGHPYCAECIDVLERDPENFVMRLWRVDVNRYLDLIERERDRRPAEAMLADEIGRLRRGLRQIIDGDYPAEAINAETWAGELLADSRSVDWESADA